MITLTQKQTIIIKHIHGVSNRSIASELHMSKDTVNKYVSEYENLKLELLAHQPDTDTSEIIRTFVEKPNYNAENRKPIKVTAEMTDAIQYCLQLNDEKRATGRSKQIMKKIDIYEYLKHQNFQISYSTAKRLIKTQEQRHKEAFIRQEYAAGDICEFDWGTVKLKIADNDYENYQMAVFTSAQNNYRFALLFKTQDTAAFQESHADFFHHCKGVYKTMVYDNMRVAVKKFVGLTEKEPTQALTELSIYYGFHFRFCNIARGNEKGHVERSVEFVRRNVFSNPETDCFETLEDANEFLMKKCDELNSKKISNGTIPAVLFVEEQRSLRPELSKFESCMVSENRVDKYATITVRQNHYSVPDIYVGKMVTTRLYTKKVCVYDGSHCIARHKRTFGIFEWNISIYHYLRTLKRKPSALKGSTALLQADTRLKNIYETYYSREPKKFLQILELIKEKGILPVEKAIQKVAASVSTPLNVEWVKLCCSQMEEERIGVRIGSDHLSRRAKEALVLYDQLTHHQKETKGEDEMLCN